MKTLKELERFLLDGRLHMRVILTKNKFHVDFLDDFKIRARGVASSFPDAIDQVLLDLARRSQEMPS